MLERLGEFTIQKQLGEGGMGAVYLAYQESLDRDVALKVLTERLCKNEKFIARFKREARSAASLIHPNVIQIYSIGEDQGIHYFAMEAVRGKDLTQIVAGGKKFSVEEVIDIITQVAEACACAAEAGIIHRDLKPANIMLTDRGLIKVTDFGLAKTVSSDLDVTEAGTIVGTANYMSPEQGQGKPLDCRSDIYSLGVVFFELLVGRVPFIADQPSAVLYMHVYEDPPAPSRFNPDIPKAVDRMVLRMMAKKPDDRPADPNNLLAELRGLSQSISAGADIPEAGDSLEPGRPEPAASAPSSIVENLSAKTSSAMEQVPSGALKVLIADDMPSVRKLYSSVLTGMKFSIIEADDGEKTIELWKSEQPSLVLLDINMPKKDGLQILQERTALELPGQIIVISARKDREIIKEVAASGVCTYLTKPVNVHELRSRIEKVMDTPEGRVTVNKAANNKAEFTGRHVIIYDNGVYARSLYRGILESFGHEVACIDRANDIINIFSEDLPDLLVLSLSRQDTGSMKIIKNIIDNGYKLPVISIADEHDISFAKEITGEKLGPILCKPVKLGEFRNVVSATLDGVGSGSRSILKSQLFSQIINAQLSKDHSFTIFDFARELSAVLPAAARNSYEKRLEGGSTRDVQTAITNLLRKLRTDNKMDIGMRYVKHAYLNGNLEVRNFCLALFPELLDRSEEIDVLLKIITDEDFRIRCQVINRLAALRAEEGADIIVRFLNDDVWKTRKAAAACLETFDLTKVIEPLILFYARSKEPLPDKIRKRLIGSTGAKELELVEKLSHNKSGEVRAFVARFLGELRSKLSINMLVNLMRDKDPLVRAEASVSAGRLQNEKLRDTLFTSITDSNSKVQQSAVRGLFQYSMQPAAALFLDALSSRGRRISEQAAQFIVKLNLESNAFARMLNDISIQSDDNRKYLSLLLTSLITDQSELAEIVKLLNSSDDEARRKGMETIIQKAREAHRELSLKLKTQSHSTL